VPKEKTGFHQMRSIDFIYMINLDHRPEKFNLTVHQLSPYNISPYRFSGIYGKSLSYETITDLGVKFEPWMQGGVMGTYFLPNGERKHELVSVVGRTYFCHCMAEGPLGCILSHLSILDDAYKSGYETIWIMEDDIQIIQNPHLISDLVEELDAIVGKNGWDVLFTDKDAKNRQGVYVPCLGYAWRPNYSPAEPKRIAKREIISKNLRKIGARYGTYSMVIRRSGMKKILDFFKTYHLFLAYDMDDFLPPGINLFTVLQDVVSTIPDAVTDNEPQAFGPAWFPVYE
jgi:GR25 family glycosyltransferase involved in LPS biosynthesis